MNTKDTPMDYKQHTPEYYIDKHLTLNSSVDDEQGEIVFIMREYADQQNASLKLELQKQKKLNAELVKIKNLVEELIEVSHFRNQWEATTEAFESLIKKSNEI